MPSAPPPGKGAPGLGDVARVLGSTPTRLAVLRFFLDRDEGTVRELMAVTGLSRNAAGHQVSALHAAGILGERRAIHPRGQGVIAYWSADRAALHAIRDVLVEHLT